MAIILASGSPRRRDLLHYSAVQIDQILPPDIEEKRGEGEEAKSYCCRLASEKSKAIHEKGKWILAADTIVCLGDMVLEKPATRDEAFVMISLLSGKWHQVISAWSLRYCPEAGEKEIERSGYVVSDVLFRKLNDAEIYAYVDSGESMDKAGGYGIQGIGACLVSEIKGSYSNIVGLPLEDVLSALREEGVIK